MVFSRYSGFLHQCNWPPQYNWYIVDSGIKHHKPKPDVWNSFKTESASAGKWEKEKMNVFVLVHNKYFQFL
jgi:hypothetical protein